MSLREEQPPRTRARYIVLRSEEDPPTIWIEDLNECVSITNDAEAVCRRCHWYDPGCRIFYKDTDGNWDELVHEYGRFKEFRPAREQAAAERWDLIR